MQLQLMLLRSSPKKQQNTYAQPLELPYQFHKETEDTFVRQGGHLPQRLEKQQSHSTLANLDNPVQHLLIVSTLQERSQQKPCIVQKEIVLESYSY